MNPRWVIPRSAPIPQQCSYVRNASDTCENITVCNARLARACWESNSTRFGISRDGSRIHRKVIGRTTRQALHRELAVVATLDVRVDLSLSTLKNPHARPRRLRCHSYCHCINGSPVKDGSSKPVQAP